MADAPWQVYIVRCADRTLYTGIAKDLAARIAAHNGGNGAKYTRGRRPVELVYCEAATGRADAQRREAAIKRLRPAAKRALIERAAAVSLSRTARARGSALRARPRSA